MEASSARHGADIVRRLQSAFENGEGVFADTRDLLENQIPRGVEAGSREHANFLFFLVAQDHGTKSAHLYQRARAAYLSSPEYFDPLRVVRLYDNENAAPLLAFVRHLGVRYPNVAAVGWIRNSHRLTSTYCGDAREILSTVSSTTEAIRVLTKFYGFGPKIAGLFYRVFVGTGLAQRLIDDQVTFPTDIHDTRLAALTRLADIPTHIKEDTYSPFVRSAQRAWRDACNEASADWPQVDRALWILGSRGCSTDRHSDCPIRQYCVRWSASPPEEEP